MAKPSLYIAVPSRSGLLDYEHVEGRDAMVSFLERNHYDYHLDIMPGNPYISQARSIIVASFLDRLYDELIFIDDDVVYTVDDFERLLSHDVDAVSGLYTFRYEESLGAPVVKFASYPPVPDERGLIATEECAAGFMRIKRVVLEKMEEAYSQYKSSVCVRSGRQVTMIFDTGFIIDPSKGDWAGEDYVFCRRYAESLGGTVYVDPKIRLGHVGRKVFRLK